MAAKRRGIPANGASSVVDPSSDREEGLLSGGEDEEDIQSAPILSPDAESTEFHQWCAELQAKVGTLQAQQDLAKDIIADL